MRYSELVSERIESLETAVRVLEHEVAGRRAISDLGQTRQWAALEKALESMRQSAMEQMTLRETTDDERRELAAAARVYRQVLRSVKDAEGVQALVEKKLAEARKALENERLKQP